MSRDMHDDLQPHFIPTYLTLTTVMALSPEIVILAKASPWALVAYLAIRQLADLLSPFAYILALRLARSEKERAALLELFRITRRPLIRLPWRNRENAGRIE
jgi:hypothetical protein